MVIVFALVCVLLGILSLIEIGQFLRARRNADDFPYPGRRLARRLTISFIFSLVVGVAVLWPQKASPWIQLVLLLLICLGLLTGLILLWRDLRETSLLAIQEATRLSQQTGEALRQVIQSQKAKEPRDDPQAKTGPERP